MNIGLDFDGVIANIETEMSIRLQQAGIKNSPSDWDRFYFEEMYNLPSNWLEDQFDDMLLWKNALPFDDGWNMCNKWFMEGHNVFIITCRPVRSHDVSLKWLEDWRFNFNDIFSGVLHGEKSSYIDPYGLDVFIEDNPEEVVKLSQYVPTFLVDKVYNRNYNIGDAVRVRDCYQIDSLLQEYFNESSLS